MRHVRVNKLLRYGDDLSLEVLTDLFGQDINTNDKLVVSRDVTDYQTMSTEDLIDMKDYIHRILNDRLNVLHNDYLSLKGKINQPDLYSLSDAVETDVILPF
jgi:hypothetical protein